VSTYPNKRTRCSQVAESLTYVDHGLTNSNSDLSDRRRQRYSRLGRTKRGFRAMLSLAQFGAESIHLTDSTVIRYYRRSKWAEVVSLA
jgi:hypothetical protein